MSKGHTKKESLDSNIKILKSRIQSKMEKIVILSWQKIKSTVTQWKYNCHESFCNEQLRKKTL